MNTVSLHVGEHCLLEVCHSGAAAWPKGQRVPVSDVRYAFQVTQQQTQVKTHSLRHSHLKLPTSASLRTQLLPPPPAWELRLVGKSLESEQIRPY